MTLKIGSLRLRCVAERQAVAVVKGRMEAQGLLVEVEGVGRVGAAAADRPPIAVLPVIDISSSMDGEKLSTACRALHTLVDELHSDDIWGLVAFDKRPRVALAPEALTESHRARAHHAIQTLRAGYLTNISGGLLKAFEVARSISHRRVTVLLLSDGLPSYGIEDEHELESMVRAPAEQGLVVSAFGYGRGCDDVLLTRIAVAGRGRYKFVEDLADVSREFHAEIGASRIVAAEQLSIEVSTDSRGVDQMFLGNVLAGQTKRVLVEIPGRDGCSLGPSVLASVQCRWNAPDGGRETAETTVVVHLVKRKDESAPDPAILKARDFEKVRAVLLMAEARLRNGNRREAENDMIALLAKIADPEARALVEKLRAQYEHGDLAASRRARSGAIADFYDASVVPGDD